MKIKTSELTGAALCYAVCMVEMPHLVWGETIGLHYASHQIVVPELQGYSPFMGWEMFGPIIEREKISVKAWGSGCDAWTADVLDVRPIAAYGGPTPLIAAMRCYVASKLGDEVEIPDELTRR